jgi:hypothetical protein
VKDGNGIKNKKALPDEILMLIVEVEVEVGGRVI